jgi:putative hydrolase of the HAD superfamily
VTAWPGLGEKAAMALRALLLDLGNVLAFHDNELLFERLAQAFGTTRAEMASRLDGGLWDRVNRGQLPGDALRRELVARLGREVSPADFFALWSCHFRLNVPMVALAERLVGRVRLVLLSNTHDQHVAFLRPQLPVLERFEGLVLSCQVGLLKPEPGIYLRALEVAGVAPAEAAFFDDVPRYAEAAAALGIHGRVFTTPEAFVADLGALGLDVPV